MVLTNTVGWYGLRNVLNTYLFRNNPLEGIMAPSQSHGTLHEPGQHFTTTTTVQCIPPEKEPPAEKSPFAPTSTPANLSPIIKQSKETLPAESNHGNTKTALQCIPSATDLPTIAPAEHSQYSPQSNATSISGDRNSSDIASGWFDTVHDDVDSESCYGSSGDEDSDSDDDSDQRLPPNSLGYDFFVRGVLGFFCEVLEGNGHWVRGDIRSTT